MTDNTGLLMEVMAHWNRFIGRGFKSQLPEGISPPMHFMIMHLCEPTSMSEIARMLRMSKQQMTKLADKVIEMGMAERMSDPNDRRVILLRATDKAQTYIAETQAMTRAYFQHMFETMQQEDEEQFVRALEMMNEVFLRMELREAKNTRKETEQNAESKNG